MIENNDPYKLKEIIDTLKRGGSILYPTDTIWGLGCDATNAKAIDKIFFVKERVQRKSLIILVDGIDMLRNYVEDVPAIALDLMQSIHDPLTIIYPRAKNLPDNLVAEDQSIAIRIPKNNFCQALIKAFGKPITSTSANQSGQAPPVFFSHISPVIINAVDYVVKVPQAHMSRPKASSIIRINEDGDIQIIRN